MQLRLETALSKSFLTIDGRRSPKFTKRSSSTYFRCSDVYSRSLIAVLSSCHFLSRQSATLQMCSRSCPYTVSSCINQELFRLSSDFRHALAHSRMIGRCQTVNFSAQQGRHATTFYLDGAHTIESMQNGADWFISHFRDRNIAGQKLILIFYCSPDRNVDALLEPIRKVRSHMHTNLAASTCQGHRNYFSQR